MDVARRLHALATEDDPRQVRERPARADDVRPTPIAHGHRSAQSVAHLTPKLSHATRRHAVRQIALGETHGAERKRDEPLDDAVGAQR